MKKFFKTIFVFILLLAVALTCAAVAYTKTSDYTDNKFPDNITINGVDCSGLTYEAASKKISDEWKWIVDNLFVPKCEFYGKCTENNSCGRKVRD